MCKSLWVTSEEPSFGQNPLYFSVSLQAVGTVGVVGVYKQDSAAGPVRESLWPSGRKVK